MCICYIRVVSHLKFVFFVDPRLLLTEMQDHHKLVEGVSDVLYVLQPSFSLKHSFNQNLKLESTM